MRIFLKTGMTLEQIEKSGRLFCGFTMQIGEYWYSIACLYNKTINALTSGPTSNPSKGGYQSKCRGCNRHNDTLNVCLRRSFDIQTALQYKANTLISNNEWSSKVSQDVSYSLVLRVLKNSGFLCIRNLVDIEWILTPLTKKEQNEHLEWILARKHFGFRTGVELVLLCNAGMCMISFDRSNSDKKIDSIGQTIVADTWFFNRLSNDLPETDTDALTASLLLGDYTDGDAAFSRRNGDMCLSLMSNEWEMFIKRKWNSMAEEKRNRFIKAYNPNAQDVQDIRVWTLPEFQKLCRLNANGDGNMVCEVTGMVLTPSNWGVDRVINGIVPGVSGEYCNRHCLIMHPRLNDAKESGGRIVFASVETLEVEKKRLGIIQPDNRVATQLILRNHLNLIRTFRHSQQFRKNMNRL